MEGEYSEEEIDEEVDDGRALALALADASGGGGEGVEDLVADDLEGNLKAFLTQARLGASSPLILT